MQTVGRRKEAVVRVRLVPGTGNFRLNGKDLPVYFPNKVHQQLISEPFVALGAEEQFDVVARISGGGVTGQAGALRLGVARALILVDSESRPALKRAGLLHALVEVDVDDERRDRAPKRAACQPPPAPVRERSQSQQQRRCREREHA